MAPGSRITLRSSCVNLPANIFKEQNELAGAPGGSDASSNEDLILSETPILPLIFLPAEDLFTKFMKVFMETT